MTQRCGSLRKARVIPFDRLHEIVQLGHQLHTGEATASDNECQELPPQFRVVLDIGFFQNMDQVVAGDSDPGAGSNGTEPRWNKTTGLAVLSAWGLAGKSSEVAK